MNHICLCLQDERKALPLDLEPMLFYLLLDTNLWDLIPLAVAVLTRIKRSLLSRLRVPEWGEVINTITVRMTLKKSL